MREEEVIYRLYDTIRNTIKPRARENIMLVILFLILCAVRFFKTSTRILECSQNRNTWVKATSRSLCKL